MYRFPTILLAAIFAATIPAGMAGELQRTITQPFPLPIPRSLSLPPAIRSSGRRE